MKSRACALKEWSGVIDAMGDGTQIIMMRKYSPAHDEFFLYPTYGFSKRRNYLDLSFQEEHHDLVTRSVESKEKGRTEIRYYALIDEVIQIEREDFGKLKNLSEYYIWSPDHVMNYFKDEKVKSAFIWVVRLYRLHKPQSIKDLGRGGLTYVYLPTQIFTAGSIPIISDAEFQSLKTEMKRTLEGPPPPKDEIKKLQAELREKQGVIQQFQVLVQEKEERIRQLESLIGPTPLEVLVRKLSVMTELSPEDFEWALERAFKELGFDTKWNGKLKDGKPLNTAPSGKPDAEIKAPLAGDPYFIVLEATKNEEERYQVTEVHGAVDHSNVFPGLPFKTCYRLVIAPRFRKGAIEACDIIGPKFPVMLLTCGNFLEILKFHEVGGITQEELKNLFDHIEARGEIQRQFIEEWENTVREQRNKLSLALDAYDILYSDKGFMWPRDIWRELKKQRVKQGLPVERLKDIHDILKILDTIGALIIKPSPDGDIDKYDYKAGLTPEGFRLRIRKLEETIRLHESKQPTRVNKLTSYR